MKAIKIIPEFWPLLGSSRYERSYVHLIWIGTKMKYDDFTFNCSWVRDMKRMLTDEDY